MIAAGNVTPEAMRDWKAAERAAEMRALTTHEAIRSAQKKLARTRAISAKHGVA